LEKDIIPAFYTRGRDGLPREWIERIKSSMRKLSPFFNTNRMVREYTEEYYMPAHKRFVTLAEPDLTRGKAFAAWRENIRKHWNEVEVERVEIEPEHLKVNDDITIRAWVGLGTLAPGDVMVQLYYGALDGRGMIVAGETLDMEHCCPDNGKTKNVHEFVATLRYPTTGKRGLSIRVLPNHTDLANPIQTGLVTWANM
jgi:starch phosphorylase